jgi:hypothetical protein
MKVFKFSLIVGLVVCMMVSCEKYEEYVFDNVSIVYFGTQRPLRTVVSRDQDMQFKMGIVLAGLRENNNEEWVRFRIEPELLSNPEIVGNRVFTILPESYYSLSNENTFIVPPSRLIGDVTVTINHELFTADPNALKPTYALPVRIYETSADSILTGGADSPTKDYTILVVKYISQYSGFYYRRGIQHEKDVNGNTVNTVTFTDQSMNKSDVWYLETLGSHQVETKTTANIQPESPRNFLKMSIGSDKTVNLESLDQSVYINSSTGHFSTEHKAYFLDYTYTRSGIQYHVLDTLFQRQDPELDLRFEEW